MDRRDFMKSIMVNNFEEYIIRHFDETMALYDLVGTCENISVSSNHEAKSIKFDVLLSTKDEAIKLKQIIDFTTLTVYDKTYNINSTVNDRVVYIELI